MIKLCLISLIAVAWLECKTSKQKNTVYLYKLWHAEPDLGGLWTSGSDPASHQPYNLNHYSIGTNLYEPPQVQQPHQPPQPQHGGSQASATHFHPPPSRRQHSALRAKALEGEGPFSNHCRSFDTQIKVQFITRELAIENMQIQFEVFNTWQKDFIFTCHYPFVLLMQIFTTWCEFADQYFR